MPDTTSGIPLNHAAETIEAAPKTETDVLVTCCTGHTHTFEAGRWGIEGPFCVGQTDEHTIISIPLNNVAFFKLADPHE